MTRKDAKVLDLKEFHSLKSCKRGHGTLRRVSNGKCPVCTNQRYADFRKRNPLKVREYGLKHRLKDRALTMLRSARVRAKKRGLTYDLTLADISIPETCPVLGIPIKVRQMGIGKFDHNSPSLDRIDNSKGYTRDNVIVVSFRANALKSNSTVGELKKIVDFYSNLVKEQPIV